LSVAANSLVVPVYGNRESIGELTDAGIVMSVVTYGEIYEGLVGTDLVRARLAQLDAFVSQVDVIAPDLEIARYVIARNG